MRVRVRMRVRFGIKKVAGADAGEGAVCRFEPHVWVWYKMIFSGKEF